MVTCFFLACGHQEQTPTEATAKARLEMAEKALADDSVRLGETLLRQAITLAEESEDWHTCYIAHQRLAESLSWSNTSEALRLMKRAIDIYEQHPDNERNHIILLDFAGTYASQLAYNAEDADADNAKDTYAEALTLTERAHDLATQAIETDLECQTLTSLANIHWAMEDYPVALDYAQQAEKLATPDLLQGTLQVLARCYLDCDSLAQAEATYRRMDAGYDIHTAYIIQSNLAKIAVRRHETNEAEEAIDSAFEEAENFYFKALEQKDDYYQATLEQEREGKDAFREVDMSAYSKKVFGMFTGKEYPVRLRFVNHLAGAVIDRFGKDITLIRDGAEHFTVTVKVVVSPQFFAWIFGFGAEAEVLSPPAVREELKRTARQIAEIYE